MALTLIFYLQSTFYSTLFPDIENWQNSLQEGMEIDYLQTNSHNNSNICSFTRAKILSIDQNNQMHLQLCGQDITTIASTKSVYIMPLNSLTQDDFEWRESLDKWMEIDILDSYTWTPSTVIDVYDDHGNKKIKYGLRVYRETSRSTDTFNNYKKYCGWGYSFDKIISVHDTRLRR